MDAVLSQVGPGGEGYSVFQQEFQLGGVPPLCQMQGTSCHTDGDKPLQTLPLWSALYCQDQPLSSPMVDVFQGAREAG